jgi:hypothetical protein
LSQACQGQNHSFQQRIVEKSRICADIRWKIYKNKIKIQRGYTRNEFRIFLFKFISTTSQKLNQVLNAIGNENDGKKG